MTGLIELVVKIIAGWLAVRRFRKFSEFVIEVLQPKSDGCKILLAVFALGAMASFLFLIYGRTFSI